MSEKKTKKKSASTTKKQKSPNAKPITTPKIAKITINIGVGEAGEKLTKAEQVLQNITGQKPIHTISKTTNKDWGLRKMMPIGCKVTLRKKTAEHFLIEALKTRENKIIVAIKRNETNTTPNISFDDRRFFVDEFAASSL